MTLTSIFTSDYCLLLFRSFFLWRAAAMALSRVRSLSICNFSVTAVSHSPTTILSRIVSLWSMPYPQCSARQYKEVIKLTMDSPSSCLRWLNLAHLNIVFLRFKGELQISLCPCRTAFPPQSNIMRWDCYPPHLPLRKHNYISRFKASRTVCLLAIHCVYAFICWLLSSSELDNIYHQ